MRRRLNSKTTCTKNNNEYVDGERWYCWKTCSDKEGIKDDDENKCED